MTRTLKGTLKQLTSGKWQASLPVAIGNPRRCSATFNDKPSAQRWLDAGLAALKAGKPLPDPAAFRAVPRKSALGTTQTRPSFEAICWKWHDVYYEQLRQAFPERMEQVGDYIGNHLVPFFASVPDVLEVLDDPGVGQDLVITFVRHLAGFRPEPSSSVGVAPALGLLDGKQAAVHFDVSVATINRRRREGQLQSTGEDDSGAKLYRFEDLQAAGLVPVGGPRGLSRGHAANIFWALEKIVEFACTRDWLDRNPTVGVNAIKPDSVRARKKAPTAKPREFASSRPTLTAERRTSNSRRISSRIISRLHGAKSNCNWRGYLPTISV